MGIGMLILFVPFAILGIWAMVTLTPVFNRALAFIWEDPQERQRRRIAARLKELHIDGDVPAETAVLMAAKELNTTETELLDVLGTLSAAEIKGLLTGNRGLLGLLGDRVSKAIYSGVGGTTKRR